jgi:hypothetical protein
MIALRLIFCGPALSPALAFLCFGTEESIPLTREVIQRLERIAGLVRADEERRDRERREHVAEELFSYDLSHPQEDQ